MTTAGDFPVFTDRAPGPLHCLAATEHTSLSWSRSHCSSINSSQFMHSWLPLLESSDGIACESLLCVSRWVECPLQLHMHVHETGHPPQLCLPHPPHLAPEESFTLCVSVCQQTQPLLTSLRWPQALQHKHPCIYPSRFGPEGVHSSLCVLEEGLFLPRPDCDIWKQRVKEVRQSNEEKQRSTAAGSTGFVVTEQRELSKGLRATGQ